jgi:hypothetical protein
MGIKLKIHWQKVTKKSEKPVFVKNFIIDYKKPSKKPKNKIKLFNFTYQRDQQNYSKKVRCLFNSFVFYTDFLI